MERAQGRQYITTKTGVEIACASNTAESSKSFGVGGFQLEADLSVFVRGRNMPPTDQWAAAGIAEKQKIVFSRDSKTYRIDHISQLTDTVWKFNCNDPNKGA